MARDWLNKSAPERMASTQEKISTWLVKDVIPFIGNLPISTIGPRDVLTVVRKMEGRGAIDSAHRLLQICGQVLWYAVATGSAERDVTTDLKGSLAKAIKKNHPAWIASFKTHWPITLTCDVLVSAPVATLNTCGARAWTSLSNLERRDA